MAFGRRFSLLLQADVECSKTIKNCLPIGFKHWKLFIMLNREVKMG
ncbi:hypothetical protein I656_01005 [Geobacillus sp. WSUCF1]|nr:hypothetical protein I656_01005 [Geobacillus sp. WSUCF1]